jgi:transposase-like protein
MPRTHQPYPPECRRRIIELATAGRSIREPARKFDPTADTIRRWIKQAALFLTRSSHARGNDKRNTMVADPDPARQLFVLFSFPINDSILKGL